MRTCEGCTKCCEGWLSAKIYNKKKPDGVEMFPGQPCFFCIKNVGCSEYDSRPQEPCKNFSCEWINEQLIPDKFKPSSCGIILAWQSINGIDYLDAVPAPNKCDAVFLSWFIPYGISNQYNLRWIVEDQVYWYGSADYSNEMDHLINKTIPVSFSIK